MIYSASCLQFIIPIILFLINLLYLIVPLIRLDNIEAQKEIEEINIFKADFSNWSGDGFIDRNVHCIITLSLLCVGTVFLVVGLVLYFPQRNRKEN